MSKSKCDCLHHCGDDPWLAAGRAEPCRHFKARQSKEKQEAERRAAAAALPGKLLKALKVAEDFMAGFEDDEVQDGINEKLKLIRCAIQEAEALA